MRRSGRCAATVGIVVLALLSVGTARAPADTGCSYDGGTRTATVNLMGTFGLLQRDGQKIMLDDAQCGTATMGNTDTIDVEGSVAPDELDLTESPGRFAGIHFDLHLNAAIVPDVEYPSNSFHAFKRRRCYRFSHHNSARTSPNNTRLRSTVPACR